MNKPITTKVVTPESKSSGADPLAHQVETIFKYLNWFALVGGVAMITWMILTI